MKFDWQHVAILGIGAALMGALIITGHDSTVTAILGTGGLGTIVAALAKGSPIQPTIAPTSVFPDEEPTRKEGKSLPPGSP